MSGQRGGVCVDPVKVGTAIRTLRSSAGYTQHQLADFMGVTDKAVSKWERGLSVPDVSIVTKLSVLLNVDVDNLLEGNIAYLEQAWQGYLILDAKDEVFCGSEAYGKPLVYFYLSYFMLAGIGEIYISCPEQDKKWIDDRIGDGSRYGIQLIHGRPENSMNTMVVYNDPFVYGPNLTKYFQRAMSRMNGISVLTVAKNIGGSEIKISYDKYKAVQEPEDSAIGQFCVPILFFPKKFFDQISNVSLIKHLQPL